MHYWSILVKEMDSRKRCAGNCDDDARKVSCSNSKIASHILPARRQPGPRGAPPAALAADALLPTPCCPPPAAHSLLVTHTQKES